MLEQIINKFCLKDVIIASIITGLDFDDTLEYSDYFFGRILTTFVLFLLFQEA